MIVCMVPALGQAEAKDRMEASHSDGCWGSDGQEAAQREMIQEPGLRGKLKK